MLHIRTAFDPASIAIGDSICTSGVCLTATAITGDTFSVDAGPETLARTTIGRLQVGDKVNLERSVTPSTRLGGHLVMGHVDAIGRIRGLVKRENAWDFTVEAPAEVLKLVIPRGSVAVDGISLTVTARDRETFGPVDHSPHVESDEHRRLESERRREPRSGRDRALRGRPARL